MTEPAALTSAGGAPAKAGGTPAKAALQIFDQKPVKGGNKPEAKTGEIVFQFNPKEYTIAKTAKWESKPAKGAKKAGPPEFIGAEPCKMTLEMFLDSTLDPGTNVVKCVNQLINCCVPTEKSGDKPKPPLVIFKWGGVSSFPAYIKSVSAKYTLFAPDGNPIRAVCTVNLEEMPGEHGKQNPTSGALAAQRTHQLIEGDSLGLIAFREYGSPLLWRKLAEFNGIDDPQRLRPGTALALPTREELLAPR